MPMPNPVNIFGIHQATIVDRQTHEMRTLKLLSEASPDLSEEVINLNGGSSPHPWNTASGYASSELPVTIKQFDLHALKYFGGYLAGETNIIEDDDGDVAGNVSSLTNVIGTLQKADTGIASVTITTSGSLKYGDYLVKAASATTVHVYLNNDLDGLELQDENMRITATPLTIPNDSGVVAIPGTGLSLTGGTGTVALTTGDAATFSVRPINAYNYIYRGGAGVTKPEFSLYIHFEKLGSGSYRSLYLPRVKSNGVNPQHSEKEWASFESTLTILNDASKGYAWQLKVIDLAR